jgi:putative transcriptional regulator
MILSVISFQLKKLLKDSEKSLYWLSKETGIAYNTLHSLNKGDKIDVRISTVERICKALKCEVNELIVFSK